MKLAIYREVQSRLPAKKIREIFELMTEEEGQPEWEGAVNLVIVSDQKIRQLNRTFRGKDKVTDVLSFPLESPEEAGNTFGEIYISAAKARRQAAQSRRRLIDEFLWLFCHGMLHLFGYDHVSEDDAIRMKSREHHFLQQL